MQFSHTSLCLDAWGVNFWKLQVVDRLATGARVSGGQLRAACEFEISCYSKRLICFWIVLSYLHAVIFLDHVVNCSFWCSIILEMMTPDTEGKWQSYDAQRVAFATHDLWQKHLTTQWGWALGFSIIRQIPDPKVVFFVGKVWGFGVGI